MLKIFTVKFEEKIENFNDEILGNFLANKQIVRWDSSFINRKNDHFWTVLVEYEPVLSYSEVKSSKSEKQNNDSYKNILTDNDWPLYKQLREWRLETSKEERVPPYIIFTNMQLAKIAVTRPTSLNAMQQIQGIGRSKKEKYGEKILQIIESHGLQVTTEEKEDKNG